MELLITSLDDMDRFAASVGERLRGGEVLELVGDVGTGKTAFTKGLAKGLGVADDVQSPSFTISRVYVARDDLELHHYDLYRLAEPGIARYDIAESVADPQVVTVIEWAGTVQGVLPENRSVLTFCYGAAETERVVTVRTNDENVKEAYAAWTAK